jgi:hypothetical protein
MAAMVGGCGRCEYNGVDIPHEEKNDVGVLI